VRGRTRAARRAANDDRTAFNGVSCKKPCWTHTSGVAPMLHLPRSASKRRARGRISRPPSIPVILACAQLIWTVGMAGAKTPWWTWGRPVLPYVVLLLAFFAGGGAFVAAAPDERGFFR
jgi:hypothetical protein